MGVGRKVKARTSRPSNINTNDPSSILCLQIHQQYGDNVKDRCTFDSKNIIFYTPK